MSSTGTSGMATKEKRSSHDKDIFTTETRNMRGKNYSKWECLLSLFIITFLLALYLIPTVFYILSPDYISTIDLLDTIDTVNAGHANCSPGQPLQKELLCYNELSLFHSQCSDSASDNLVVSISNDVELQQYLRLFLEYFGLHFITYSSIECQFIFRHLHCMLGYRVCDGNKVLELSRKNSSDVCEVNYVLNISSVCKEAGCAPGPSPPDEPFMCSESFYYDNNTGLCVPECGWVPSGAQRFIIAAKVCAALTILFPMLYFMLAFTIQKQWLYFPSIYYIFINLDIALLGIVTIVELNLSLFCNVQDHFLNMFFESPSLCYFTGTLQVYCLIQSSYWLLFYAAIVYWSLMFPFSYEQAKNSEKIKHIFLATIFIGILFPFLAIILVVDGFYPTNIIFNACSARNPLHFYIAFTLHLSVIMCVCSVLLFLDIQALYRECLKSKNMTKKKFLTTYKIAEIQLMIVVIVFVAMTVSSMVVNVYLTAEMPKHYSSLNLNNIVCHSGGVELATNCERFEDDLSPTLPIHIFSDISLLLQSCISLVTIVINSSCSNYASLIKTIRSKFM